MIPVTALAALRAHWKLAVGIGALIALAMLLALYRGEKRHSAKVEAQLVASVEARKADRVIYQTAQVAAQAKNEAQVARIETDQEKASAELKNDFDRDLARLRAGGVRQDLAAVGRATRSAQASGISAPACQPDGENMLVSRALIMQAAEIELGRNALIDWINRQIDVTR